MKGKGWCKLNVGLLILWDSFAVSVQFQQPIIICLAPKRMSTFILAFLLANIHLVQENYTKYTRNLYEWQNWGFKTGITKLRLGMKVSRVSRMTWNCVKSWKQIISSHKYEKSQRLIWGLFVMKRNRKRTRRKAVRTQKREKMYPQQWRVFTLTKWLFPATSRRVIALHVKLACKSLLLWLLNVKRVRHLRQFNLYSVWNKQSLKDFCKKSISCF